MEKNLKNTVCIYEIHTGIIKSLCCTPESNTIKKNTDYFHFEGHTQKTEQMFFQYLKNIIWFIKEAVYVSAEWVNFQHIQHWSQKRVQVKEWNLCETKVNTIWYVQFQDNEYFGKEFVDWKVVPLSDHAWTATINCLPV